jgi:hypothetical protein
MRHWLQKAAASAPAPAVSQRYLPVRTSRIAGQRSLETIKHLLGTLE